MSGLSDITSINSGRFVLKQILTTYLCDLLQKFPQDLHQRYFISCKCSYSFQVMVQKHNRQMSFSLYISALAVSDSIILITGWFFTLSFIGLSLERPYLMTDLNLMRASFMKSTAIHRLLLWPANLCYKLILYGSRGSNT